MRPKKARRIGISSTVKRVYCAQQWRSVWCAGRAGVGVWPCGRPSTMKSGDGLYELYVSIGDEVQPEYVKDGRTYVVSEQRNAGRRGEGR